MKILSHNYKSENWIVSVGHNGKVHEVHIELNRTHLDDSYYMGYLKDNRVQNKWIVFGFSNYKNTVRYILEAIKKVIEGDYSSVVGAGFCIDKPNI